MKGMPAMSGLSAGANLARVRLYAEMLLWRTGWLPVLAAALLLAALILLAVVVPVQSLRLQTLEDELARAAEQSANRVGVPPPEAPLQTFRKTLMPQTQTIDLLRQIHQIAANTGVITVQADLRRLNDTAGVASQLQIALPARGDYLALRRFCYSLLGAIPSLSIDQILFKREQTTSNQLEAQIILSVWQLPERKTAGEQP